jgi:PAS domain S-box-containing protein
MSAGTDTHERDREILSDSTVNLLRAAGREVPTSRLRVRLLIALPVTVVLLLSLLAGILFWMVDAYFGSVEAGAHLARSQQEFANDWLLLLILFDMGGAIIGFGLAYSITRPIVRMIELSERVAGGDLRQKVNVQRADEVGALSTSFDQMVESLHGFFEQRNRFILESFSGGLITTDVTGTVTAVNTSAERMLGLESGQVAGASVRALFKAPGLSEFQKLYEESSWKGEPVVRREVTVTVDGHSRRLSVNCSPMRDHAGNAFGLILNFRDLDEVQRFYEQMQRADRLATMGTFAAGLSHEVRNPLGAIKGTAQLLAEDVKEMPRASEYARVIVKEVNRLDDLVREVQAYSHPTAEREPTDIARVCTETVALARNNPKSLLRDGVQIIEHCHPVPIINVSQDKLSQALLNIIINALQHTPEGGVVEVTTRFVEAEPLPVHIEVSNSGTPIPEDQLPRIFEPFFSTRPGGSGLGLSIASQVVTYHGGELQARNHDGKVTFTIKLPLGTTNGKSA